MEQPLGLNARRGHSRRAFPRLSNVAFWLAAIAIFGTSSAIALRDRPFRQADQAVVSIPQEQAAAQPEQQAAAPAATEPQPAGGASIIRVDPPVQDNGVVVIRDPSALGQNLRVAHLPNKSVVEETEFGPLPVRAPDGTRPFDVYRRPWSGARGARVAIVIGGLGVSQTGTQAAIEALPPEITLALASGGNSIDRWMQTARRQGHEILMQVPLEPFDYPNVDPGRNTLTVDAGPAENAERLRLALSRTTNYTGVMNYLGARFTAERDAMQPVMGELAQRGLMYLDDGSSARSLAGELAQAARGPYAAADLHIDQVRERGDILRKLDEAERIARAKGSAIAIGSAFDATVSAVVEWANEARKRGIEIVPVSALAIDPERQ
ncbi:MAG: divergent polysaccharide deacetylase family protein [Rhizobiaceae bacterium]|nr:divergent polysaccharide deacetylase family protein [Rhizobiaceae bacterium]